jgi:hypothetical protein
MAGPGCEELCRGIQKKCERELTFPSGATFIPKIVDALLASVLRMRGLLHMHMTAHRLILQPAARFDGGQFAIKPPRGILCMWHCDRNSN